MRDEPDPPAADQEPTDFDWASPRWREADGASKEDHRRRRFQGDVAPGQRGAIDAGGSVPSSAAHDAPAPETPSTEG